MSGIRGKNVLVTGSCGFIGSHLTERLVAEGARVTAFVYYNSFGRRGWLDAVPEEIMAEVKVFNGDVRDYHCVRQAAEGAEIIMHLAALIGIPYSYVAPDSYVDTNIKGTLNVLQAARELGTARIVHTSTSEVYGTARYVPIDEKHPLQGQSPYSATKIGADKLAESFHLSFALPVVTVRPFNTYGPRQSSRAVIPTVITQALAGQEIKLGNLSPTRDFNYVADTVDAFVKAAVSDAALGQVVNIGSGREITIGNLCGLIMELTGREADIRQEEERLRPPASEVERLCAANAKARELLGWEPEHTLREGLRKTIAWMEKNIDGYRTGQYAV